MRYRSLIGGALGDVAFGPGDEIVPPSTAKADEWLAAGLIEPVTAST